MYNQMMFHYNYHRYVWYGTSVDHQKDHEYLCSAAVKSWQLPFQFYKNPSFRTDKDICHSPQCSTVRARPVAGRWSWWRAVPASAISLYPHTGRMQVPSSQANINLALFAMYNTSAPFIDEQPLFMALCPLLYWAAIGGGGGGRRGEGQAVKQFPPSESHSDPHTGDWGLTPARQWHKHRQTKGLGSEQVGIL